MHSNPEEGVLLITFDGEGREELLQDIETVIKEQDHEFGTLGDKLTPEEPRGGDWKLNEFYNIIWKEDAPLHVDDSVTISGGKIALTDLYNRIRLLPAGCRQIELAAEPSKRAPEKTRFRQSKRLFCLLLIHIASALVLVMGALMHVLHSVEGHSHPSIWHHVIIYTMFIATLVHPLWLLGEILPAGRRQKCCHLLTGIFLLPGLLTAAPVYLFELHLLGIDSYGLRLPISLLIIAAAVSIFFYLRQQMRKQ